MPDPTEQEKALEYYRTAAIQRRTGKKPAWVPARIYLPNPIRGYGPFRHRRVLPGEYDCQCNAYGAVSVRATNGEWLGLHLDEFEVVAWQRNPKETTL